MGGLGGKRAVVLGLGRSGRSAARFLAARGARVVAADERPYEALEGLSELGPGIELCVGQPFPALDGFDLVVPSPGVPARRWQAARPRVMGDVELAWRALTVPVVAVTGTNGKTTTTLLIEAMLRAAGWRAEAAGNLGRPALELVGRPLDAAVLEVSSFQLEAVRSFRPRVAVVLNLAPDHLDWHETFEAYVRAKARILEHQHEEDTAVLNADDPRVRRLAPDSPARRWLFSSRSVPLRGAGLDVGSIVLRDGQRDLRIPLEGVSPALPLDDLLAALLACHALGADVHKATAAWPDFEPPPHRCQVVAQQDGITWIDDSKATNPSAAMHALHRLPGPLLWLAGGRSKGVDLGPLAELAAERARAAVLFGESAEALEAALAGRIPTRRVPDLEAAVETAHAWARPGDTVLLSPACASFDQFQSFEERGERFRALVQARLASGEARR